HIYAEVPPRVEYEVTEFGRSLEPILVLMQKWGSAFKARQLAAESEGESAVPTSELAKEPSQT
ncbi:MAG: winged helix-turn-helix transcriptional regulator, partial [Cyanobacteria bacterium J06641_5]